jgi:hypothetical protein
MSDVYIYTIYLLHVHYIFCLGAIISRNVCPSLLPALEMSRVFKFHELEFEKHDALQAITNYFMMDI